LKFTFARRGLARRGCPLSDAQVCVLKEARRLLKKQISYSGETCEAAGFNEVVTKLAHTGLFDLEEIPGHGTALICR